MLRKSFAAIAALALVAGSSSAAIAQSAQPAAPAAARAGADTAGASELGSRGYGIYIIGALLLAAVIYGVLQLTDGGNDPESP